MLSPAPRYSLHPQLATVSTIHSAHTDIQLNCFTFCAFCFKFSDMKTITASQARQNFGEFLETGIREPIVIKRHRRELGIFLPMTLYSRLVEGLNANVSRAMDDLQVEVAGGELNEEILRDLLAEENPS
jgi:PHD/YefM family antitoxin component YafN of YafNO toxin-antitoxin module